MGGENPNPPINQFGPGEILTGQGSGTGRWVYVGWNEDFTWRMGYCRENACIRGHGSPEDAIVHFRQWLLDQSTRYDGRLPGSKACRICSSLTATFATVVWLGVEYPLCPEHLNREGVEEALDLTALRGIYR